MGLISELADLWRKEMDKRRKQKEKYRIEYAFTSGGTKYYRYADISNLPYERGLSALCVYNELEMRCSRQFLEHYVDAMHKVLRSKQIDIYKINALVELVEQRLKMPTDVDLMYKLASVCFFDDTENPRVYDPEYAERKIAKWRKDKKVADFFTQMPLLELMPFLQQSSIDLDTYMEVNKQLNKLTTEYIRTITSTIK